MYFKILGTLFPPTATRLPWGRNDEQLFNCFKNPERGVRLFCGGGGGAGCFAGFVCMFFCGIFWGWLVLFWSSRNHYKSSIFLEWCSFRALWKAAFYWVRTGVWSLKTDHNLNFHLLSKHRILQNSEFLEIRWLGSNEATGILWKSSWQAEPSEAIHIFGKKQQTFQWGVIKGNSAAL